MLVLYNISHRCSSLIVCAWYLMLVFDKHLTFVHFEIPLMNFLWSSKGLHTVATTKITVYSISVLRLGKNKPITYAKFTLKTLCLFYRSSKWGFLLEWI